MSSESYLRTNITMGPVGFEPTTASAPGVYLESKMVS
jgi:hypothetical protein